MGRSKVGAYSGRGVTEHTEYPHSLMTRSRNMCGVRPHSTPRNLLLPGLTIMRCKGKIYPRLWGQMPSLKPHHWQKLGKTPAPKKTLCKWSGFKGIFPAYFAVFGLTLENKNKRWGRGWHREGLTAGTSYFTEHVHSTQSRPHAVINTLQILVDLILKTLPILQMRKQRHLEAQWLSEGHRTC